MGSVKNGVSMACDKACMVRGWVLEGKEIDGGRIHGDGGNRKIHRR